MPSDLNAGGQQGFPPTVERIAHWALVPMSGLTPEIARQKYATAEGKGIQWVIFRAPGGRDGQQLWMDADAVFLSEAQRLAIAAEIARHPGVRTTFYIGAQPERLITLQQLLERWGPLGIDFIFDAGAAEAVAPRFRRLGDWMLERGISFGIEPTPMADQAWWAGDPRVTYLAEWGRFHAAPGRLGAEDLEGRVIWLLTRDTGGMDLMERVTQIMNTTPDCAAVPAGSMEFSHVDRVPRLR